MGRYSNHLSPINLYTHNYVNLQQHKNITYIILEEYIHMCTYMTFYRCNTKAYFT